MADTQNSTQDTPKNTNNEVALEMMKFIAVQTGYGKGVGTSAGFGPKSSNSPEQYAEALLELFQRCKKTVEG
ncbi:MAG: hypothetical protein OHK0021_19000 [Bryobacter sp.]|nr:hypothetical protein [Bryobacter sp.]